MLCAAVMVCGVLQSVLLCRVLHACIAVCCSHLSQAPYRLHLSAVCTATSAHCAALQASEAVARYQGALEQVKLRDMAAADLQKKVPCIGPHAPEKKREMQRCQSHLREAAAVPAGSHCGRPPAGAMPSAHPTGGHLA